MQTLYRRLVSFRLETGSCEPCTDGCSRRKRNRRHGKQDQSPGAHAARFDSRTRNLLELQEKRPTSRLRETRSCIASSVGRDVNLLAASRTRGSNSTSPTVLRKTSGCPSTQCTARSTSTCSRSGSYQVEAVRSRPFHGARLMLLIVWTEAQALTGLAAEQAVVALGRRYRVACVKLGRDGAVAAFEGSVVRIATEPLETTEELGAGDAFAAGFLLALAHGAEPRRALHEGCRAAASTIS